MQGTDKTLRQRIITMRWVLSLVWIAGVVIYQLIFASWVQHRFSEGFHYFVEILFYGSVGPLLSFWFLWRIDNRLGEMERVEKKAQTMERRLASITHISADAILSLDTAGQIVSWNPGAEELFGFLENEVLGQLFSALMGSGRAAETEIQWIYESVRREGYLRGHESVCFNSQEEAIHVELTAIPLSDENREFLGLFLILRDISSRKRREEEIRRLNKSLNEQVAERTRELNEKISQLARANADLQKLDQTRTEFVSLVSHQLRAPLTNMSGAVENIRVGCKLQTPACSRMLAILDQQTTRLDRLVEGVLSTARIEAGELTFHTEPISIHPLAHQIVEQFRARQVGRTVHLTQKPGLPLAFADRDRVAEVMTNLLDNANKYSPQGTDIFVGLRADQDEITVSVSDQGPGIPPGDLDRVFEKFYRIDSSDAQTAYGYGLGLYVCGQLVKAMGGRIWVENHPEGGAVFSFTLPVWQERS
ncbi:MAG TPA: ATP-binding protein [Anaerolineales bacterium]|nr:ATP-binding protein [Anaerolineales bacterium]